LHTTRSHNNLPAISQESYYFKVKLGEIKMKKILLATSILAMSSAAMAATSTTVDSEKTATLNVIAHYVEPLTVALDLSTIDFGDVYTDSVVAIVPVEASLTGTVGETFTYDVASDGSLAVLTGDIAGSTDSFAGDLGTGTATLNFNVGLNTANLTEDTDVDETVTITVQYNAIAGTETTATVVV
jgi:hypothetical protein